MAQAPAATRKKVKAEKTPPSPRRQRLMRDITLILIAPLLLYLMASLFTYSSSDPGFTHSGSLTAPLNNVGGLVGAKIADGLLLLPSRRHDRECGEPPFRPKVLFAVKRIVSRY